MMTEMHDDPEALALAVIAQALRDVSFGALRLSSSGYSRVPTAVEAQEAEHFLLDEQGSWAEARTLWCEAANVEPSVIRRQALQVIERREVAPPLLAPPTNYRGSVRAQAALATQPRPDTRSQSSGRQSGGGV